ncbi:ribonuclease HII [Methanoplanus sp. FWC-SCC4]|uniref:Ribonuclease HII n=1 Tax=Methanochimaera problematica TaxID=2609417 RepID=A0AA97I2P4_9EURY|nr:ribonuclease HII [Methanoplanus sp. FWC-SCC4]WOF15823.1 ribonuclease HII [Methanoplanus sp. FWC-SCC4]
MICGIDEAGKGSVLGPMVIGGVKGESLSDFTNSGYNDSKKISAKKRDEFFEDISKNYETTCIILDANRIDECRITYSMNDIVAMAHAKAIDKLAPKKAYVDACDVNEVRYGLSVKEHLKNPVEIISEHKADEKFRIVSAASIIAKVTRDRLIENISEEYGKIGSGYPSDPVTIEFLKSYIKENGEPPVFSRKSWKTVSNVIGNIQQKTLFEF